MKFANEYSVILLGFFGLLACQNKSPEIKILDVEPQEVRAYQDSILISLEYYDPNGDLGSDDPDDYQMYVFDSRIPEPMRYHVPKLLADSLHGSVRGIFNVLVPYTINTDTVSDQTFFFEIILQDRKGKKSNSAKTPILIVSE